MDLLEEAKLKRIGLTKDIVTPSEEYSHEVIRLAKLALGKYGYHLWSAEELETRKEEWKDENAVFFYNHNQELEEKMYNKKADLILQGYDTADIPSIIRFELTLKRKFMKLQGWIREEYGTPKELPVVLTTALAQAPDLMRQHITDPLWSGETLSKDRQKKRIRCHCKRKTAKYKRMMDYRRKCNSGKTINAGEYAATRRYFAEIQMSPLYTTETVGCIPAFGELLVGDGLIYAASSGAVSADRRQ